MIPIADALVKQGHNVWWYTGKLFEKAISESGAKFVPMQEGLDYSIAENVPTELSSQRSKLKGLAQLKFDIEFFFIKAAIGNTKDLLNILEKFSADVILADSFFIAASWVNEKTGIPWAQLGISVLSLPSKDTAPFGLGLKPNASPLGRLRNRTLNGLFKNVVFRSLYSCVNEARAELSLSPTNTLLFDVFSPHLYLAGTVPSFEYPRSDLPNQVHFIGPLLPKLMPEFTLPEWWEELKQRKPIIHVSQGTVATDPNNLIIPTIKALANEPVLVIATLGKEKTTEEWEELTLLDNVRVESFIPYHLLFPHIDIVVSNGGYNGVQMALAHGIPLVAAGKSEDKMEICTRIEWSRVGINLKTDKPTPKQLQKAIQQILDNPHYRQQAQKIQTEIVQSSPAEKAAKLLQDLANRT